MNYFISFISLILLSAMAQSMEAPKPWYCINEEEKRLEVPFRTYTNSETGKTITLLSMCHVAQAALYQSVNEFITGKAVVYELHGQDWAEACQEKEEIKQLDKVYLRRLLCSMMNKYFFMANHYGISCQMDCLNYDLAGELFHADLKREAKISPWAEQGIKKYIDAFIIQQYGNFSSHFGLPADEEDIDKMAEAIFAIMSKEMPDLKSLASLMAEDFNSSNHQKHSIQNRNPILEQRTLELLANYDELVVTYGTAHYPDFESFLLKHGFALRSETWMTVFNF